MEPFQRGRDDHVRRNRSRHRRCSGGHIWFSSFVFVGRNYKSYRFVRADLFVPDVRRPKAGCLASVFANTKKSDYKTIKKEHPRRDVLGVVWGKPH